MEQGQGAPATAREPEDVRAVLGEQAGGSYRECGETVGVNAGGNVGTVAGNAGNAGHGG